MKVILAAAITADGFIGKDSGHLSTNWTSKEDIKFFVSLSKQIKHLVVGHSTFRTFTRQLTGRKLYVYSKQEVENPHNNDIEVVTESPLELVGRLEREGVEQLMIAGGSSIYTLFMQSGVVNELFLTVEPVVFGEGIKLFAGSVDTRLELLEVKELSPQTKVLHYKVKQKSTDE